MNKWTKIIQSALLPPVCVLCGDVGDAGLDLCRGCRQELPQPRSSCARCAEPLSIGALEALCGRCQVNPPAFERAQALFAYQAPVDHLLQGLKFDGRLEMARLLGTLMGRWLTAGIDELPDVLVPVPLHASRLRERGFNQALELARPIARQLGIPLDLHSCRRLRATGSQLELSRKARIRNVKGAFEVLRPLQGRVAVIDDVMTTGSTASELARVLLKAGADSVQVWVCARA